MKDKENKKKVKKVKLSAYGRKMARKERRKDSLFLMPSFFGVSVFYIVPFFVVIAYAFEDNPITKNYVGITNFVNILQNEAFKLAASNTFKFSLIAVPLAVIISLLMAILLDQSIPLASQFRTVFLSPMMVPVASIVLIWQVLFSYNGTVNVLLELLGKTPIDWLNTEYAWTPTWSSNKGNIAANTLPPPKLLSRFYIFSGSG